MILLFFGLVFTKVVIFAEGWTYEYFEDYVEAVFGKTVTKCFWGKDVSDDAPGGANCREYKHSDTAIFIGIPTRAFYTNISYANANNLLCFLVTEQATRKTVIDDVSRQCRLYENLTLIHYTPANLELLKSAQVCAAQRQIYLPFLPCDTWDSIDPLPAKKYDVSFVGAHSERRMKVLQKLEGRYRVHILPSTFRKDRQLMLAESKILINIHFSEDYRVLETMRCTEAVLAGALVLSETGIQQNLTVVEELFFFAQYGKLVESVDFLVENFDRLLSRQLNALSRIRVDSLPPCVETV